MTNFEVAQLGLKHSTLPIDRRHLSQAHVSGEPHTRTRNYTGIWWRGCGDTSARCGTYSDVLLATPTGSVHHFTF